MRPGSLRRIRVRWTRSVPSRLFGVLALCVALSACGGEDPDEVSDGGVSPQTPEGATDDAGTPATHADEPGQETAHSADEPGQETAHSADAPGQETAHSAGEAADPAEEVPEDAGVRDASLPDAAPPQLGAIPAVPDCTTDLFTLLSDEVLQPPGPDSDAYHHPTGRDTEALSHSIRALVDGQDEVARDSADAAGYTICRAVEAGPLVFVWRPILPGSGRAILAWNAHEDARRAIFEAPHPYYDEGTLSQAVIAFRELQARAVIVAGTYRCANAQPVVCSGRTGVCGDGEAARFRASDMAHNDETLFHAAHITFSELFREDRVISLHGTGRRAGVISDGTTDPVSADAFVARLTDALVAAFPGAPPRTCNAYPGAPQITRALCGTTNVQGRHLNGSSDACMERASRGPDAPRRFVHLEQSPEMRDTFERVIEVLDTVLD